MSIHILLADDHRMVREALHTILERELDMTVVGEAGDGFATLKLARELAPNVVVLDIGMPELNGIEVSARLRRHLPAVKIIALSAHTERRYVLEMLKAGADGYVAKAAAGRGLVNAIRAVVAGKRYLCPQINGTPVSAGDTFSADPLARREREVLQLIAEGKRTRDVAERLHISPGTVEVHRRNIMRKLGVRGVAELTRYAIREGLSPL